MMNDKKNANLLSNVKTCVPVDVFRKAHEHIRPILRETRLIESEYFSSWCQGKVYLKPENLQRTGAYKVRGAFYKIGQLSEEEKERGLIAASAGNHAQGLAYAAHKAGVNVTIVMPEATPLLKIDATKSYGAHVILYGKIYDEAQAKAYELCEEHGYTFVHPFDDVEVATGQGTMVFEILEECPETDVILVPMGGGGLAAGVAMLAKQLKPSIRVIGVEPSGAASLTFSLEKGERSTLSTVQTIADGAAVATPGKYVYPHIETYVDEIITVDDIELVDAFLGLVEKHKLIAENAGLLTLAALKKFDFTNQVVVPIISGGNIDVLTISSMIQRGLRIRDRIFTFGIELEDKPGELLSIARIVAESRGNVVKLEHNQFVDEERFSRVELEVTVETFGTEHKNTIVEHLISKGYPIRIIK